jgi:hypothetical protein
MVRLCSFSELALAGGAAFASVVGLARLLAD